MNAAASLHIDPNPINPGEILTIRFYNGDYTATRLQLTDELGTTIYQSDEFTEQVVLHKVKTDGWKPGIYTLSLVANKVFARRIVHVKRTSQR